ncbi:hypothetical protein KUTeg_018421 [Tegillarca granosa]|uniref:mitogen-activated protein kinase kinase n=1 Tax=Tegillarca granosa TaxID=220873 RepID=A0ABQ9EHU6_TEGGR|nr:hypothetical protein KUTeg_018421 [Tegillarca granosa]
MNLFTMNSQPPFTIRIRTDQNKDIMDWMVQPDEITFRQALEVISRVLPQSTVTAFEYEDEDGDRMTVRSDEEMKSMFQSYFSQLSEEDMVRGLLPPLIIFPRVGKTPQNRNIHGLKVKTHSVQTINQPPVVQSTLSMTDPEPSHPVPETQPGQQDPPPGGGSGDSGVSQEVTTLPGGNISESDLQILQYLGKGNSGQVHRVLHKPSGTIMAVKASIVYNVIQLDVDVEAQKQIISELQILCKCNSPAIIGFYGAFFVENRISICTEFMDGGSLDKYWQIPEPVLGRMAVYIIQGLLYMWSLKILHRDIKPSNVLVNTMGQIKLCDFGVSVQLVESIARTYVGTNAYMAPERIRGEEYSTPAEVWSLGVCLYEQAEFFSPVQLLNSIVDEEPPVLSTDVFSHDFVDFVSRSMQKLPVHRLTPEQLMLHPFIVRHNDGNINIIASWVKSKLEEQIHKAPS